MDVGPTLLDLATLYNLKDDIAEEKNLAATHGEKLQAMSDLLDGWEAEMSKTAIPFVTAPRNKKYPTNTKRP